MGVEASTPAMSWRREWVSPCKRFKVLIEFTSSGGQHWFGPRCTLWQKIEGIDWIRIPLAPGSCFDTAPGTLEELADLIKTALHQLNDDRPDCKASR